RRCGLRGPARRVPVPLRAGAVRALAPVRWNRADAGGDRGLGPSLGCGHEQAGSLHAPAAACVGPGAACGVRGQRRHGRAAQAGPGADPARPGRVPLRSEREPVRGRRPARRSGRPCCGRGNSGGSIRLFRQHRRRQQLERGSCDRSPAGSAALDPAAVTTLRPATRLLALLVALFGADGAGASEIAVSARDLGGVVTGDRGPEAGVWVIAETMKDQHYWIETLKNGCQSCHALGSRGIREIPEAFRKSGSSFAAWARRTQAGQAMEYMARVLGRFGAEKALKLFADWTDRIAAGELPFARPERPKGVERHVVGSVRDRSSPTYYLHDAM